MSGAPDRAIGHRISTEQGASSRAKLAIDSLVRPKRFAMEMVDGMPTNRNVFVSIEYCYFIKSINIEMN